MKPDRFLTGAVRMRLFTHALIFGEIHQRRDELCFLNELIPLLYHRAGLRCVAMEGCLAADNAAIERLVTASDFDRDLAMAITVGRVNR